MLHAPGRGAPEADVHFRRLPRLLCVQKLEGGEGQLGAAVDTQLEVMVLVQLCWWGWGVLRGGAQPGHLDAEPVGLKANCLQMEGKKPPRRRWSPEHYCVWTP